MAHLQDGQFIVGGKSVLVLSGEIHYFRLRREDWLDRVLKAKQAGCNAVASYIPWLFHEEEEGDIDVLGRKSPEHDLGAFVDLCRSHGLWFIARPGPFTMGEIKNEGIPDWVYTRCPDAIPTTWGGKKATSKTLSYLQPDFLRYVERWYTAVGQVLGPRTDSKGGNVIACQLDNEIGMLQCWTEEADLSDDVLCEFAAWVQTRHDATAQRDHYPFDMADPFARAKYLRDGSFAQARFFHADYTEFTRDRFARYAAQLRQFAENAGIMGIPLVINIHGSGGGRATTFPIGVSQTFQSYTQADGYWGSSDHYLGELTRQNVQDLYFLNAFMACLNRPEQPLSSIEFEAGTGDYGENGAVRQSGAATDFKARLSVVQGNRMLNHYLLAGGHNPKLERPKQDGNSRVGTTGGRHGFAAPIDPEGKCDPTYFALKDTNHALLAVSDMLATMREEHDDIALGFVPDYYSTDVKRPGPMQELANKLESARGFLEGMTRSMLAAGLSFPAVNLQNEIPLHTKAIALACSPCLHREVQTRLLEFVHRGGNLLLYGRLPREDLEGRSCTVLMDGLGIVGEPMRQGSGDYFPSLVGKGWAASSPEFRIWQLEPFSAPKARPVLSLLQTELLAAAQISHGSGHAIVVTAELPLHLDLWRGVFEELGARPAVTHDSAFGGVILSRMTDAVGNRFISLINLDQEEKVLTIREEGRAMFSSAVHVAGKRAKLLPVGLSTGGMHIHSSTAEIARVRPNSVEFRQTREAEQVVVRSPVHVEGAGRVVTDTGDQVTIEITPGSGFVTVHRTTGISN